MKELSMFYGAKADIFKKAAELRNNMTKAEQVLWEHLQKNKVGGYRFKPQHPIKFFIVDFYCHKAKLVIEIDGNIHEIQQIKERDEGRTYEINELGLKLIRFTNDEVINETKKVVEKIIEELQKTNIQT